MKKVSDFLKTTHSKFSNIIPKKTTYKKEPECHYGTIKIFKDVKSYIWFYGGGSTRGLEIIERSFVLNLANRDIDVINPVGFKSKLLDKYKNERIDFQWRDFGPFVLGKDFWKDLVTVIRRKNKDVLVCCIGGHGRTGTALAILAGLTGATKTDPVKFIRDLYCKKIVESENQIEYIEDITGIQVNELPAKISSKPSFLKYY